MTTLSLSENFEVCKIPMASSSSKQLREHLQEQQKPFVLDVYLSERRIMLNKNQKRQRSYDLINKRGILQTKKILKLLLRKFTRSKQSQQVLVLCEAHEHDGSISKTIKKPQQIRETKCCPEASSSVSFRNSFKCNIKDSHCHENHASVLEKPLQALTRGFNEQKATEHKNLQWECKEENEQLSPVSVLREQPTKNRVCQFPIKQEEEDASASSTVFSCNAEEDTILTAFLWDLLVKSLIEKQCLAGELQEIIRPANIHVDLKNKIVLRQSTQLLFDCVNEAVETHKSNRRKKHSQDFIGAQELGKIICEQILSGGKQNVAEQIKVDVYSSLEDGYHLQQLTRKIGIEIGDAIMNDMMQEEIDLFLL